MSRVCEPFALQVLGVPWAPGWGLALAFLRGCFHGAGADPGDPHTQGKGNRMDKSLLSRSALVNLSLCGMFLAPTRTSLCGKLHSQHMLRRAQSLV